MTTDVVAIGGEKTARFLIRTEQWRKCAASSVRDGLRPGQQESPSGTCQSENRKTRTIVIEPRLDARINIIDSRGCDPLSESSTRALSHIRRPGVRPTRSLLSPEVFTDKFVHVQSPNRMSALTLAEHCLLEVSHQVSGWISPAPMCLPAPGALWSPTAPAYERLNVDVQVLCPEVADGPPLVEEHPSAAHERRSGLIPADVAFGSMLLQ